MGKTLGALLLAALFAGSSYAQVFTVTTRDGQQQEVTCEKGKMRKYAIILNSGQKLLYEDVAKISTDHYDAYEQAVMRTARGGCENVEVKFTGDENIYALRLEKPEQKRKNADLQRQQKKQEEADDVEAQWRQEYGNENVDGLVALIEGNYPGALAFANAGETSYDANHRWAAVWLKAIIYADKGDEEALNRRTSASSSSIPISRPSRMPPSGSICC